MKQAGPTAANMTLSAVEKAGGHGRNPRERNSRLVAVSILSFWSVCELLPVDLASAFGGFAMSMVGRFASRMRKVYANLAIALPKLSPGERNRLARRIGRNLGRTWAEMPHLA